jgi:hypothetical protein
LAISRYEPNLQQTCLHVLRHARLPSLNAWSSTCYWPWAMGDRFRMRAGLWAKVEMVASMVLSKKIALVWTQFTFQPNDGKASLVAQNYRSSLALCRGNETRLASPCNIWAKSLGDVKTLGKVVAGTKVTVMRCNSSSANERPSIRIIRCCLWLIRCATMN